LVELPERSHAWVHALDAREQLATNGFVANVAIPENRTRDGDGPLRVVGGLADSPFVLSIAEIARDPRSGWPLEPPDAVGIPPVDALAG
jgi:hypothetical protein